MELINFNLLMYLLLIASISFVLFVIYDLMQFKHFVRVRVLVNGRRIIHDVKAREIKNKDGTYVWRLRRFKDDLPLPPPEAIDVNRKGKLVVEAYRDSEGNYTYIKDTNDKIETFQPLTTKQRSLLIHQIAKAHDRKTKRWQDALLPIASIGVLGIVAIALMVFYGDMGKPLLEMGDRQASLANTNLKIIEQQNEIWAKIIEQKQIISESEQQANAGPPR